MLKPLQQHVPDARVILDIVHVSEYRWQTAHAFWGAPAPAVKPAVWEWRTTILQGRVATVVAELRKRLPRHRLAAGATKTIKKTITCFESHRDDMRYDEYLAAGYPSGTGVIESACGHVVKNRMEPAGTRWSPQGAEAMLQLRGIFANGHWDHYLDFRQEEERQRLYPRVA